MTRPDPTPDEARRERRPITYTVPDPVPEDPAANIASALEDMGDARPEDRIGGVFDAYDIIVADIVDLVDEVLRLRSAPAAEGWRPIETAPKDGTQIIVTNGRLRLAVRWWSTAGWGESSHEAFAGGMWEPTHWTPLPVGPSLTTEREDGR